MAPKVLSATSSHLRAIQSALLQGLVQDLSCTRRSPGDRVHIDAGIIPLHEVTHCLAGRCVTRASGDVWATPEKGDLFLKMQSRSGHSRPDLNSPALHSDQRWDQSLAEPSCPNESAPRRAPTELQTQSREFPQGGAKVWPKSPSSPCCVSRVAKSNCLEQNRDRKAGAVLFLTLSKPPTVFNSKRHTPICTRSVLLNDPEAGCPRSYCAARASEMHTAASPQLAGPEEPRPTAGTPGSLFPAATVTQASARAAPHRAG